MRHAVAMVGVLLAASCSRDVELPPKVPSSIQGRVVAQEPGTGLVLPAAAARVEVVGTGVAVLSDAQGLFRVDAPPPPPRTLRFSWSSSGGASGDRQKLLTGGQLDGPGQVALGDVLVAANATLRGRVLLADQHADALEQIGTVVFVPRLTQTAVTGVGGAFELHNLPPGPVSLGFSRPGYVTSGVDAVQVEAGATGELQVVTLSPTGQTPGTGTVQGKLVRADHTTAAGATVTAMPSQGGTSASATVADDGSFSIPNLKEGPYLVDFQDPTGQEKARVGGVLVKSGASPSSDLGEVQLSTAPLDAPPPSGTAALPVALAGPDLIAAPGLPVALDGTGSVGDRLVFHWSSDAGVAFSLNDSNLAQHTTFVAPGAAGPVHVALVVADATGQRSQAAGVLVWVDHAPTAALTAPAEARTQVAVTLDATASADVDPLDALTFHFVNTGAPGGATVPLTPGATPAKATFTALAEGTYRFRVVVSDGHISSTSAEVSVLIADRNHAPVAQVAAPALANPGDDVVLDGSGSYDPDPNDVLTYQWTAVAGAPPPRTLTTPLTHVTAPAASGTFLYKLTVTDPGGLSSTANVALTVNGPQLGPVAAVVAIIPADQSTNIAVTAPVEVDYSQALDGTSVRANASALTVTPSAGGAAVQGTTSYVDVGAGATQRHALLWRPAVPLASGTAYTVQVAALTDLTARQTAPKTFSFTTGVGAWVDVSPPDPQRTGRWSGAVDGGVSFSDVPMAPALATNPAGQTFLLDYEEGGNPYGAYLRRWNDGTQLAPDGGVIPMGWTLDTATNTFLHGPNGCCQQTGMPGSSAYNAPFRRTYLGLDPGGLPSMGYDIGDTNVSFNTGTLQFNYRPSVQRDGASFAHDGVTGFGVFRGQDNVGSAYFSELWIAPVNVSSLSSATMVGWKAAVPGVTSNGQMQQLATDTWLGPPAAATGSGQMYVAAAVKTDAGTPYAMQMWSRLPGDTGLFGPPLSDGAHPDGGLNVGPVSMLSSTAMASAPGGPVLVFLENPGAQGQLRAVQWSEATRTFVDLLTGAAGSSVIAPAQLDGLAFTAPNVPAVATSGAAVYVAFSAFSGTGGVPLRRIFVAHADKSAGAWRLDPDKRTVDGALNARPGCDASPPSIAFVGGMPAVAWTEICAVPGQPYYQNFLYVRRLQ